jgi:hypothetical protein
MLHSTKGEDPLPATVGLNAGDNLNFTTVTHSNTDAVINISSTTNVDSEMTGIWAFQVNQAQISGILTSQFAANTQWNYLKLMEILCSVQIFTTF